MTNSDFSYRSIRFVVVKLLKIDGQLVHANQLNRIDLKSGRGVIISAVLAIARHVKTNERNQESDCEQLKWQKNVTVVSIPAKSR